MFVFACNDKDSFDNIKDWMNLFNENSRIIDFPKLLIGNKCDLKGEIDENLINEFSKCNNIKFIKTSAKDNMNINESIEEIAKMVYQKHNPSNNGKNKIIISYKKTKHKKSCIFCTAE